MSGQLAPHPAFPAPKLVYIGQDGEGRPYLRFQTEEGVAFAWPLDLKRCLTLVAEVTSAARELARDLTSDPQKNQQ